MVSSVYHTPRLCHISNIKTALEWYALFDHTPSLCHISNVKTALEWYALLDHTPSLSHISNVKLKVSGVCIVVARVLYLKFIY